MGTDSGLPLQGACGRQESGRSLVCEAISITHCNADPEPAKPGLIWEFTGVSPPPGVAHLCTDQRGP